VLTELLFAQRFVPLRPRAQRVLGPQQETITSVLDLGDFRPVASRRFGCRGLAFEQAKYQCRTTLGRPALNLFWPLLVCHLPLRGPFDPCTIGGSISKGSRIGRARGRILAEFVR
jgi:hypothetical protein